MSAPRKQMPSELKPRYMVGGTALLLVGMGMVVTLAILHSSERAQDSWVEGVAFNILLFGGVGFVAIAAILIRRSVVVRDDLSHNPQVGLRCRKCEALNDEAAKFCNQCGAAI